MIDLSAPLFPAASAAEELILKVFWCDQLTADAEQAGGIDQQRKLFLTVRQIAAQLSAMDHFFAYTTVATLILRLEKKQLIRRLSGPGKAISFEVTLSYSEYRAAIFQALSKRYPQPLEPDRADGLSQA